MKRKIKITAIFLLIILVIGITTFKVMGADDTPANSAFDDFNFYKCVIDAYNEKHLGSQKQYSDNLSDTELESIISLDCSKNANTLDAEKITSAKGLEKITELKTLRLLHNNLSEIDVTSNTELTSLNLTGNNLSEIDLSTNTKLEYLNLSNNNLSEIDVRANTQLTKLDLGYNNLSEIDVTKNTELTSLDVSVNDLSEIDLSKNTQLSLLWLLHNNLSEIDLSANTKLEYLNLSNNNLSEIDVTSNTQLTTLDLIYNNLSEIDLSANTQLSSLWLSYNNLSEIDLKANTKLIDLQLLDNNLLSLNINELNNCWYNISPQTRKITPNRQNNKYTINLKEYDNKLDPSKVKLEQEGIEYDNNTGIISFIKMPIGVVIEYTYITGKEKDMNVTITLTNLEPILSTFYIGGQNNPEYATSTTSSIYLTWDDEDVEYYCISKTNSSTSCDWQRTSGKTVSTNYTLDSEDGTKTLYAFIKDHGGLISEVSSDSIILDTTKPTITAFYLGGESNPEYATSTTTSIYLTWNDEDVTQYCISKTNSSSSCDWQSASGKTVSTEYILSGDLGSQTRYAYIKDKVGLISELKEDSIILQTEKPLIKEFYIGGKENPKYTKSIESKIYLRHEEEDIEAYCITTINDSSNCEWINMDEKEIETEITLDSGDGVKTRYAFLKNKAGLISEVSSDNIILDTTIPEIKVFSIGGISNPEKIESNETSIYLMWEDDDVVKYCINTEENSDTCEWINTSIKEIVQDYTLASGDGEKTLYAYIQDEVGYISNVKIDKVVVNIPIDEPLPESPQTGGYTIGLILVGGVILVLTYKYYISKKDKLKRI